MDPFKDPVYQKKDHKIGTIRWSPALRLIWLTAIMGRLIVSWRLCAYGNIILQIPEQYSKHKSILNYKAGEVQEHE